MRQVFLTGSIIAASLMILLFALQAADDPPVSEVKRSEKAVVKDVVYCLEVVAGRFYLTSQSLEGADREKHRKELTFAVHPDVQVKELSLAKLGGKNLTAVVKSLRGDEYEFHCLTFIAPWEGHVRDDVRFSEAKFHSTKEDLKILAVGGRHFGGSVVIVLGDIAPADDDSFDSVAEGMLYFSVCPWPPSDGVEFPFRIKSVSKGAN